MILSISNFSHRSFFKVCFEEVIGIFLSFNYEWGLDSNPKGGQAYYSKFLFLCASCGSEIAEGPSGLIGGRLKFFYTSRVFL